MNAEDMFELFSDLASEADAIVPGLGELLYVLGGHLQEQPPERQHLVLLVLAAVEKAYELGEAGSGIFLLQVALIMSASEERSASYMVQDTACAAALKVVRAMAN